MSASSRQSLVVSGRVKVRRERILPVSGEVLVEKGARVGRLDPVARALLPGDLQVVKASAALGISAAELEGAMLSAVGDSVKKGQALARTRSFFGMSTKEVVSPVNGTVESVSKFTGQVMVRAEPRPLEMIAYLPGEVVEVKPGDGVAIEAEASLVQGVFGVGAEAVGRLAKVGGAPGETLDQVGDRLEGRVLFCGGRVGLGALKAARRSGASGLIGASVNGADLAEAFGCEINPAATGGESFGFTLVVTEGFGDLAMSHQAFEILSALEGREVSLNGTTQVRAGAIRPEVLALPCSETRPETLEMKTAGPVGARVRVVRGEAFGSTGSVSASPPNPRRIETGALAHVYEVALDSGRKVVVPRQNVEEIDG